MYIGDYLARRCVYSPEKIALIDVGQQPAARFIFRELNDRANRVANWLRSQGVGKGDRVGMLAKDGVHFYDALFACGKLGAIFVPYTWRWHPEEIAGQIQQTTPKILIYESDLAKPVRSQRPDRFVELSNFLEQTTQNSSVEPVTCESLTEDDTACLLFTGGTTGTPKAAQISHRQIVWNTFNAHLADVQGSDVYLNIFPLYHTGGFFSFAVPILILGGTVIQTRKFEAEQVLELIEKERVTIFAGVPTVFQQLTQASNWKKADLSSLRYCLSGGAPLPLNLIEIYQREKNVVFRQGFGMTEFGPDVFSLSAEDSLRKMGSIGKPNFFVDARIVDPETNQPLPPNEVGELVLRGPVATTGYFNNPKATRQAFDDENYFHTGDLAYMDEEGYFYIVDRLKDMYISGGENIYPAEIEKVLYQHPAVHMCAVVGVDDEKWGQVGWAFVVLKEGQQTTEQELLDFLAQHLAKFKIPKKVIFRNQLPISGAGKILKQELKESIKNQKSF
ncbi:MAG: long-chain fatty acid--CoA ligase [Calditrichaeota bacterium]|nr:MAG: long-chain fatty acid--CoA ligase [Calditrichota bacterium]